MFDLATIRHRNRPAATLATYLDHLANNKNIDTRILITTAKIERTDALQRWLNRDWLTYHRTYFLNSYNHTV
jgi:hypothetical protein